MVGRPNQKYSEQAQLGGGAIVKKSKMTSAFSPENGSRAGSR